MSGFDNRYMTAEEAAAALGVSRQTLYVYVGRKGIRSQAVDGSRQRKYWKADIERIRTGETPADARGAEFRQETGITLITEQGHYYRGVNALDLAERASFEEVAGVLWGVSGEDVFAGRPPVLPKTVAAVLRLMQSEDDGTRATAVFPILEEANPRAFDLSPAGMARCGADVLRALAAVVASTTEAPTAPIHAFLAARLGHGAREADLIRRVLVLAADHGFEPSTVALRAIASTGVSPWRTVMSGLSIFPFSRLARFDSTRRLMREIAESDDPIAPLMQRIREGEELPGFGSSIYPKGDPRVRALLAACETCLPDDQGLARLNLALKAAREIRGLEPNLMIPYQFILSRLGVGPRSALFCLARAAGWIAHSIEQHQMGEIRHLGEVYTGPLPG